jgi:hypothetical protein
LAYPQTSSFLIVSGVDTNGCSGTAFVYITVRKNPTIKATSDTTICFATKLNLSASGGASYKWTGDTSLGCSICPITTFTGNVFSHFPYKIVVEGTDQFQCKGQDTVSVTVRRPVSISTSSNDTICAGQSTHMVVRAGGKIKWLNSSTLNCDTCISPRATPTVTTTYFVKVTDMYNCTDTAQVTIGINPLPITHFFGDSLICKGDTGKISLTSTGKIKWLTTIHLDNPNSLSPKIWPSKSGHFELVSTSKENCSSRDSVYIEVQDPISDFTINGTGATKTFDKSASKNYDKFSYNYNGAPGTPGTDSFEFSKNGSYTVCLTVTTDEGCKNESCKNLEVKTVSVENLRALQSDVKVFPNPISNRFQISSENLEISDLEIFNLQGKSVYKSKAETYYDISTLSEGNYILHISSSDGVLQFPIVKIEAR